MACGGARGIKCWCAESAQLWLAMFAWTSACCRWTIFPNAEIGDEVVLIGRQGDDEITATEIAEDWGTINYEVVCGLASRMPRVYLK